MELSLRRILKGFFFLVATTLASIAPAHAQGVTTAAINGIVTDTAGDALPGANVVAIHEPTRTTYGASTRLSGAFTIPNMKVGGPYTVTVSFIGFETQTESDVYLSLAQNLRLNFRLAVQALEIGALLVTAEQDEVLNPDRTGAATTISPEQVMQLPSIKRTISPMDRVCGLNHPSWTPSRLA